jgi:hypothetical protein
MTDAFHDRAVKNVRDRHTEGAIAAARRVQETAGFILRDLEAGRIPGYSLVDDALDLSRRTAALDTHRELTAIYATSDHPAGPVVDLGKLPEVQTVDLGQLGGNR